MLKVPEGRVSGAQMRKARGQTLQPLHVAHGVLVAFLVCFSSHVQEPVGPRLVRIVSCINDNPGQEATHLDGKGPLVPEFQRRLDVRHIWLNRGHDQSKRRAYEIRRAEVAHFRQQGSRGGLERLEKDTHFLEECLEHEHVVDGLLRLLEGGLLGDDDKLGPR